MKIHLGTLATGVGVALLVSVALQASPRNAHQCCTGVHDELRTSRLVIVNAEGQEVAQFFAAGADPRAARLELGMSKAGPRIILFTDTVEGAQSAFLALLSPSDPDSGPHAGDVSLDSTSGKSEVRLTGYQRDGTLQVVSIHLTNTTDDPVLSVGYPQPTKEWPAR